ncbi:MAG: cobalamin B12-binding domain-containing protein [Candidatus Jordarchaeum sp.]|uniref:cobalamin B12-binding domain-containing protein n=1 Tax=Candidatus Jordarchaeum sp. TaxID=2823881 RepID=UPI00404B1745
MADELLDAMANLERSKLLENVKKEIKKGEDPLEIIDRLSQGLKIVGDLYDKKEYFLAELITAGEIFQNAFQEIKPVLEKKGLKTQVKGKIVIGTVRGDLHDIGKNIVITMLVSSGFYVEDLGVDVTPERFIEAIREVNADILGMSALLTVALEAAKETIKLLEKDNLKDKVKVICGGAAFDENTAKKIGADAYAKDPLEAVKICQKFLE